MTKFADQLFTDLMREHGPALADTRPLAGSRRQLASRRALVATGVAGLAAAATAGALVAVGGGTPAGRETPAYALTTSQDGTITLAVYHPSGISQANAKLHQLGDRVVVVPIRPGCPSVHSLPPPMRPADKGSITVMSAKSRDGSVKVRASGIPAGDILVVGVEVTAHGSAGVASLTSPPAPSCVSAPPLPGGTR